MSPRLLVGIVLAAAALAVPAAAAGSNIVAYWPMIEGNGQIVHDISGHGNDGVLGTSTAVEASDPTWIRAGVFGGLHFAGGQFVTVPDSPSLEPAQVTVLALVRGASSPGTWRYVVSKGALGCTTGSYGLYTGFGGGLAFYVWDGSRFHVSPEMSRSIWNGRWHVVAGTYDGTTVRLYVDGAQVGKGTTVPPPAAIAYDTPIGTSQIGGYGGCDLSFVGDVDEVSIWNGALPIGDILPHVQALLASLLH